MEENFEVDAYCVQYRCDYCHTGFLESLPPKEAIKVYGEVVKIVHRCNQCQVIVELGTRYPEVRHRMRGGLNPNLKLVR